MIRRKDVLIVIVLFLVLFLILLFIILLTPPIPVTPL